MLFKEILGGQECGACVQEGFQDGELLDRQVQAMSVAGRGPRRGVELDPGCAEDAGSGGGLAAGEGADAQHELGEVEWLGEVVIGAEAQAADPVLGVPAAVSISTMARWSRG